MKQIIHTQLWFKHLGTANGFPDVVIHGESKAASNMKCDRIIACKGTPVTTIHWLIQSGYGADCWFAWIPKDTVVNENFVSIEPAAL